MDGLVSRDPGRVPLLLRCLPPLLRDVRALAPPPIHWGGGYRAGHQCERLGGTGGTGQERGPLAVEEVLQGFTQVFDQMKAIDHLHGLGGPTANTIGVEGTPVPTDDGDCGMLRQPGGHALCGALGQQVQDAMILQIDEDGPIAVPTPPGPLIYPNALRGDGIRRWSCLHEPQEGVRAGPQP
jgi:hypothetical protein